MERNSSLFHAKIIFSVVWWLITVQLPFKKHADFMVTPTPCFRTSANPAFSQKWHVSAFLELALINPKSMPLINVKTHQNSFCRQSTNFCFERYIYDEKRFMNKTTRATFNEYADYMEVFLYAELLRVDGTFFINILLSTHKISYYSNNHWTKFWLLQLF